MNIGDVKTLLKTLIENKTDVTPMLWGPHGIGKSSLVQQVAKDMGYSSYSLILSQKEAVDVGGMLYTFRDNDLDMSVTAAHPPEWFAEALKKGRMVLFLDEFNMARREVLNAAFELVLDKRLNNRTLPQDVFIICAGNPDDERYDVTPLSESLRDRLMHIKVTSDVKELLLWASQTDSKGRQNYPQQVVDFLGLHPEMIRHTDNLDEKFPVDIKHSERSWRRLSEVLYLNLPERIKRECYRGIVGVDASTAFMKSLESKDKPLQAEDILTRPEMVKDFIKKYNTGAKTRMDLLSQSASNLTRYILLNKKEALKSKTEILDFITVIPNDLALKLIQDIVEEGAWPSILLSDKRTEAWMKEMHKVNEKITKG